MIGRWQIMSNIVGGVKQWQLYRIIDQSQPMHSGNIETTGEIFENRFAAQYVADLMNDAADVSVILDEQKDKNREE